MAISSRDTVNPPMGNRALVSLPTSHQTSRATRDTLRSKDTVRPSKGMAFLSKDMAPRPLPATPLLAKRQARLPARPAEAEPPVQP
jgi:hypothetical protein